MKDEDFETAHPLKGIPLKRLEQLISEIVSKETGEEYYAEILDVEFQPEIESIVEEYTEIRLSLSRYFEPEYLKNIEEGEEDSRNN